MIRKVEERDYEELSKLVYQVHELHYENRPDIYANGNPLPREYFENMLEDATLKHTKISFQSYNVKK